MMGCYIMYMRWIACILLLLWFALWIILLSNKPSMLRLKRTKNNRELPIENLAFDMITGFYRMINMTGGGICINLPSSAGAGLPFGALEIDLKSVYEAIRLNDNETIKIWNYSETFGQAARRYGLDITNNVMHVFVASNQSGSVTCQRIDTSHVYSQGRYLYNTTQTKTFPCEVLNWWPLSKWGNPLMHPYTIPMNASWCFQFPRTPGSSCPWPGWSYHYNYNVSANCIWSAYFWASLWASSGDHPWDPLDAKVEFDKQPTSPLWECTKILNCSNFEDYLPYVWQTEALVIAFRQACLCYNYTIPVPNTLEALNLCNITLGPQGINDVTEWENLTLWCKLPQWHAVTSPDGIVYRQSSGYDHSSCTTAWFSSPKDTMWVCSDGNMYSHIQPQKHAGLQCGLGIPSMCPTKIANFSHHR
ncbi:uncharacterized protein M6G45_001970 [Spheniscus humboldti]